MADNEHRPDTGRHGEDRGSGQGAEEPAHVAAEEPQWVAGEPERVTLQRSMKTGRAAAAGAVALIAVAAIGSTALGALGAGTPQAAVSATPTRATPTASRPLASESPSGMLTMASVTPVSPPTTTRTRTTTSTTKTTTTTTTTSMATTTTTTNSFADIPAGPGSQECGRSGSGAFSAVATGDKATSCSFALKVWNAYNDANVRGAGAVLSVAGADGTTRVLCSGSQPVVCVGTAGRVLIYGGQLTG